MALQASHIPTVMQKILESMEKCKLIPESPSCKFAVSGRTDKGVSGLCQVLSITLRSAVTSGLGISTSEGDVEPQQSDDLSKELDYVLMLNSVLPWDIRILAWSPVPVDFSARFECTQRSYVYYFPLGDLNLEVMSTAASHLKGTHDFRNFCTPRDEDPERGFVRHVFDVNISLLAPDKPVTPQSMCKLTIHGSGFLYHQIRYVVSILALIGSGAESITLIDQLLDVEKTPAKPNYTMASDFPLLFFGAQYPENVLQWQTSEVAQRHLIRHFQNHWVEHSIRSSIVKTMLDHVEERFKVDPFPMHYLDKIIPEVRVPTNRKHRSVLSRPVGLTAEAVTRRAQKRKKPDSFQQRDTVDDQTEQRDVNT